MFYSIGWKTGIQWSHTTKKEFKHSLLRRDPTDYRVSLFNEEDPLEIWECQKTSWKKVITEKTTHKQSER